MSATSDKRGGPKNQKRPPEPGRPSSRRTTMQRNVEAHSQTVPGPGGARQGGMSISRGEVSNAYRAGEWRLPHWAAYECSKRAEAPNRGANSSVSSDGRRSQWHVTEWRTDWHLRGRGRLPSPGYRCYHQHLSDRRHCCVICKCVRSNVGVCAQLREAGTTSAVNNRAGESTCSSL